MDSTPFLANIRDMVKSDGKLLVAGPALALSILVFDLMQPLGVAGGIPYIVPVLLCFWARHPYCTYLMAAMGTILTVAGYYFSPEGGVLWVVLTNRALAVLAIWAVALFSARRFHEAKRRKLAEAGHLAAKEGLSESEARLQLIMDAVPTGISYFNREVRFRFANRRYEIILNKNPEDLIGKSLEEVLGEKAYKRAEKYVARALAGEAVTFENTLPDFGTGEMTAAVSYLPHRLQDGTVDGFFAVVYDITKRKEAEDAIRASAEESEARFRQVFSKSPLGIGIVGPDNHLTIVNESFCRMLGYSEEELTGLSLKEITHPEDVQKGVDFQKKAFAGDLDTYRFRKRYLTKSGKSIWANLTASLVRNSEDGPYYIGMIEDISEQKRAEEELHESQAQYRSIVETTTEGFWRIDADMNIVDVNEAMCRMLGYSRDEILGKKPFDFVDDSENPELRPMMEKDMQKRVEARAPDCRFRRKDGSPLDTHVSATNFVDRHGNPSGRFAFISDLTEQKERDAQLRQAQKMDAVGQLTGGVAHEFNNLLMVVLGNIETMESKMDKDDPLRLYSASAMKGALRGAELTKSLLAFSREQRLETSQTDLNRLVRGMQSLYQRTLGEAITIETNLAKDLWLTSADAGQIEAALLNFVLNARDAMPSGGTIRVRTSNRTMNADTAAHYDCVGPGEYVTLEVSDTGTGMTEEALGHAFEPFYSTKEVGKGAGLGLSVAFGFAKQSGGCLEIESKLSHGTTVRLSLPRAEEEGIAVTKLAQSNAEAVAGSGKIVVLEDDAEVCQLVSAQLTELGYEVFEAGDGPAALLILDEHPDIDLLFSDVVLPGGMSGPEAAERARENGHPDLKVLFTSGYPEKDVENLRVGDRDIPVLAKPYQKIELAKAVAAALNAS